MTFYETLTAAIKDLTEHGFDSQARVDGWQRRLRRSALEAMISPRRLEKMLTDAMVGIYKRLVDQKGVLKFHPGVSAFTIDRLKPKLRRELDRAITANANLIKLNREKAIQETEQRFAGWATSVPAGGSKAQDKPEVQKTLKKALKSLPYEERRVLIDQGHKLTAAINRIVALDGGAIAAIWHSHWRARGYNYREDHKERDERVYLIRGSWAHEKGLVKPGEAGYTDQITQPGEEVFCRCAYQYVYALKDLPDDMITQKGRDELERVKKLMETL